MFLPLRVVDLVDHLDLVPHPEGGFFRETYRSGSTPMSTHGSTDLQVEDKTKLVAVVLTNNNKRDEQQKILDQEHCRHRNALTSIFWVPTTKSPWLALSSSLSDHVHYSQGGQPFEYYVWDPTNSSNPMKRYILGPDIITAGHVLQVPVAGGCLKAGRLLHDNRIPQDYALIAEAVGPGFDVHDFRWGTQQDLENMTDVDGKRLLESFLVSHLNNKKKAEKNQFAEEETSFTDYYENDDMRKARAEARM